MPEFCANHPSRKAQSFCHSCKKFFCEDCLVEGEEYYYCRDKKCIAEYTKEMREYKEVAELKDSDIAKIIVDGKAVTFCKKCLEETTSEKVKVSYLAQSHSKLLNERNRCEECGSVMMDLRLVILPFMPFQDIHGTYRIIKTPEFDPGYLYLKRNTFISRKIKSN